MSTRRDKDGIVAEAKRIGVIPMLGIVDMTTWAPLVAFYTKDGDLIWDGPLSEAREALARIENGEPV